MPSTHCKRGHALTDDNSYIDNRGGRSCKACSRERPKVYKRRVRSAEEIARDKTRNRARYLANREEELRKSKERYRSNPQRAHAYGADWRRRNPDKVKRNSRRYMLANQYAHVDYDALFAAQSGCCAICGNPESRTHESGTPMSLTIDHDHVTGKVRGLLCGKCNRGLGMLGDSLASLRSAVAYLERADA